MPDDSRTHDQRNGYKPNGKERSSPWSKSGAGEGQGGDNTYKDSSEAASPAPGGNDRASPDGRATGWMTQVGQELFQKREAVGVPLKVDLKKHRASEPTALLGGVEILVESAKASMTASAEAACQAIADFSPLRLPAFEHFRELQSIHNTNRLPVEIDWLFTIFFVIFGVTVEGASVGALLIADGKMSEFVAFSYGMAFALINITVAMMAGFLARGCNYRTRPGASDPAGRPARIASAGGTGFCILLLLVLLFSAARTRATGHHSGIFFFDEVGLFATFNDSLALALISLGFVASIIGFRKGYKAILDPIWGYLEAYNAAKKATDDKVQGITDDHSGSVEETFTVSEKRIKQTFKVAKTAQKKFAAQDANLNRRVLSHNAEVHKAKASFRAYCAEIISGGSHVKGQDFSAEIPFSDQDFDALLIAEWQGGNEFSPLGDGSSLLAELRASRDSALAQIATALACFKASSSDFFNNKLQGNI